MIGLHLHWSGYGLTAYVGALPITPFFKALFGWLPGLNAYNIAMNCGLSVCGYPLTNIMHGVAGGLIALTVTLLFVTFQMGWYLFLSSWLAMSFPLTWEWYELAHGVTRCNPADFGSIAQVCAEMMAINLDQLMDILYAFVAVILVLFAIWIVDKYIVKGAEIEA
jgi:hypothetical protein